MQPISLLSLLTVFCSSLAFADVDCGASSTIRVRANPPRIAGFHLNGTIRMLCDVPSGAIVGLRMDSVKIREGEEPIPQPAVIVSEQALTNASLANPAGLSYAGPEQTRRNMVVGMFASGEFNTSTGGAIQLKLVNGECSAEAGDAADSRPSTNCERFDISVSRDDAGNWQILDRSQSSISRISMRIGLRKNVTYFRAE